MKSPRLGQNAPSPTPDVGGQSAPSAPTSPRAWIVVFSAGVLAAMHVWKFPGAMHLIRQDLNVSLVEAGTLLGIVQVAAMLLGLAISVASVRLGMRRTLLLGLALLGVGSLLGAMSTQTWHLMVTRGVEGIGFILATIVGPPLIRQLVPTTRVASAIGWWSAFQGTAVFIAMIVSTFLLSQTQLIAWNGWWVIMAVATFASMAFVVWKVPQGRDTGVDVKRSVSRVVATVRTLMPWVLAIIFATYTLQWGAIIGFLPEIVSSAGLGVGTAGVATAVVGGVNGVGNVIAGTLLQRGVGPQKLVIGAIVATMVLTTLLFAPRWDMVTGGHWYQLGAAGLFSGLAAAVPAVMTRLAVEVAPKQGDPSAVIALMSQVYSGANFVGPVLFAALATATGSWHQSWVITVSASVLGLILAAVFLRPNRLMVL